jgi:hypothetical protein
MSRSSGAAILCRPVTITKPEQEPRLQVPAPVEAELIEADQEWWRWRFDEPSKQGDTGSKSLQHHTSGSARDLNSYGRSVFDFRESEQ